MVDRMTNVQQVLSNPALIPWIEENALEYVKQHFTMASRVTEFTDMSGWNTRKVSEKEAPGRASQLAEATDIPSNNAILRRRLASIDAQEWGDVYEITNRRFTTDPESVLADAVSNLGYSLGRQREELLFNAVLNNANSKLILSAPTSPYTTDLAVNLQTIFEAKSWADSDIFQVIHPFQELDVKLELIKLSNPAVPEFRNRFINEWNYGGFGNMNIAVSGLVPRKVRARVQFGGTPVNAEVFRLRVQNLDTADIAVSTTATLTATNIQNALNAIFPGAYTVSGTTYVYPGIIVQSNFFYGSDYDLDVGLDVNGAYAANVTGGFTVQEISAVARAPFFQRIGVVHDIRQPVQVYQQWFPRKRVLEIGATEVYGIGPWKTERNGYIETDATAPNAVP